MNTSPSCATTVPKHSCGGIADVGDRSLARLHLSVLDPGRYAQAANLFSVDRQALQHMGAAARFVVLERYIVLALRCVRSFLVRKLPLVIPAGHEAVSGQRFLRESTSRTRESCPSG